MVKATEIQNSTCRPEEKHWGKIKGSDWSLASVFKVKREKRRRKMKQHLNPKSSHIVAAFVPLEKLMCWKETRNKKEKGQKENGGRSGRGGK